MIDRNKKLDYYLKFFDNQKRKEKKMATKEEGEQVSFFMFKRWANLNSAMPIIQMCVEMLNTPDISDKVLDDLRNKESTHYSEARRKEFLTQPRLRPGNHKFIVIFWKDKDGDEIFATDHELHEDVVNAVQGMTGREVFVLGGGRLEVDKEKQIVRAYDYSQQYGKFNYYQVTRILKRMMKHEGVSGFQLIVQ